MQQYVIVLELGDVQSNLMRSLPNEENCKLLASRKIEQKVNDYFWSVLYKTENGGDVAAQVHVKNTEGLPCHN